MYFNVVEVLSLFYNLPLLRHGEIVKMFSICQQKKYSKAVSCQHSEFSVVWRFSYDESFLLCWFEVRGERWFGVRGGLRWEARWLEMRGGLMWEVVWGERLFGVRCVLRWDVIWGERWIEVRGGLRWDVIWGERWLDVRCDLRWEVVWGERWFEVRGGLMWDVIWGEMWFEVRGYLGWEVIVRFVDIGCNCWPPQNDTTLANQSILLA